MVDDIGAALKAWRRAARLKQAALANRLGVNQATVSRWENGTDTPSAEAYARLRTLIGHGTSGKIGLERQIVENQLGIRAMIDIDGIRLIATSSLYKALWPEMLALQGQPLADRLVGLSRELYEDRDLVRAIRRDEVAMISGVSDAHVEGIGGAALRHRWTAAYRKIGTRHYAEISFEPCGPEETIGLRQILRADGV